MNFYALIIGTEILNGRRVDKHFEFIKNELARYNHELFASFIIKDDKELIKKSFELIKSDKNSIMFSFGGIGSTPDDLTRAISAEVFTNQGLVTHDKFKKDIIQKFAKEAYPHRIHMADLPINAKLIFNPVNNMSGFSLENRFFFVPGFPSMAHPMLSDVIKTLFSKKEEKFRFTLLANTSENTLISIMHRVPSHIELSSLPIFKDNKPNVELSLSGSDEKEVLHYFNLFRKELDDKKISYKMI